MNTKFLIIIILILTTLKFFFYKVECFILFRPKKLDKNYKSKLNNITNELKQNINKNVTLKEYNIKTKDNKKINLLYLKNPNSKSFILYSHGNSGNIYGGSMHILEALGKYSSIVLFDYRGYGKSTGNPTEKGVFEDINCVWNFMIKDLNIKPNHITLYGRSLGASAVAHLGHKICNNKKTKPHSVIMQSGFSSVYNMLNDIKLNNLSYLFYPIINNFNSEKFIKEIGNKVPILISHSPDDEVINYNHKNILIKSNNSNTIRFYKLKGGHNSPVFDNDYTNTVISYLYNI